MNLYTDIPVGENSPEEINIVVEIPKGSSNKYEYDEEKGYFSLDRVIYSPVFFSFEYGFIPGTLSKDGDPLDCLVLTTYPTFPGCTIEARPLGVLLMEDEKGTDNKIIAVPKTKIDPRFEELEDVSALSSHQKKEIQEFFETYKRLEPEKYVNITGWEGKEKATKVIGESIERYEGKEN